MKYRGKEKEYHKEYYQKRRQERIDYLGGKCVQCESTENLEFDHIDPSQKKYGISDNHFELERIKDELDKCQLLCYDCHKNKTNKENSKRFTKTGDEIQHGIVATWMRRKCQCEICLAAKRKWYDERNQKRRKEHNKNGKIKGQTHCKNGHLLDENNLETSVRKNGYINYRCKQCHREREKARQRKLKLR